MRFKTLRGVYMTITERLKHNAEKYGNDIALVEREPSQNRRRQMTWDEFNSMANRSANALFGAGVRKGDRVVLLMTNCIEWLPIYFGILRSGAWAVPLNFRFTGDDIRFCVEKATAKAVLFGEEFVERLNRVKASLDHTVSTYIFLGNEDKRPVWAISCHEFLSTGHSAYPKVSLSLSDGAALYFTSGTTGRPKAVLLTHRNLEFACEVEKFHHRQTRSDNFLCMPPLYHTGAKMHWFGNFIVGAKAVLLKGVSPKSILEAISEEQATIVWLLVPWAHDILIAVENGDVALDDYDLSSWRLMHIGAQPVPPVLIKKWKSVFPHHEYDTNYGLTEASGPGCVHLGIENLHKVGAIGKSGYGWQSDVVDDDFNPVSPGTPGELIVRGPGVMQEYYGNPEASDKTLIDGWLLTGDIARIDEDGFIWLVDRKKDVVITGGENIFPVEIENFLLTHNCVQDVGVIGLPDERLGEIAAAVIQVKPGKDISPGEIAQFAEELPKFKRPRKIIFGEVPRNPTGKIEKPKLRQKYSGMVAKA
jgi:acyl-CoA synthetase (AMP-forming)/AMP-acid ligase II